MIADHPFVWQLSGACGHTMRTGPHNGLCLRPLTDHPRLHLTVVVEGKRIGEGCWCEPEVVGDVIVHRERGRAHDICGACGGYDPVCKRCDTCAGPRCECGEDCPERKLPEAEPRRCGAYYRVTPPASGFRRECGKPFPCPDHDDPEEF